MMGQEEEARDLERAFAEVDAKPQVQALEPFEAKSEKLLQRIPDRLAAELRVVLRQTPTKAGQMNPLGLADAARQMLLLSVADTCDARAAAGMTTDSLAELGTPGTIDAISARVGPSTLVAEKGCWGPIKGGMLLADVRKLVIFVQGSCTPEIGQQQRKWSAQPKRFLDDRVCTPEEYIVGACAIGAVARILRENGYVRGDTLARDAALLALCASAHPRHSELHRLNVGDVRKRVANGMPTLSVTIRMTKTNRDRIVLIQDPRIVDLVNPLLKADKAAPLFREEGSRLDYSSIGVVLDRVGTLATGKSASANIVRRSATLRQSGTAVEVGPKLGQVGERTAEEQYTPDLTPFGVELLNTNNERSRCAAAAARSRKHDQTQ